MDVHVGKLPRWALRFVARDVDLGWFLFRRSWRLARIHHRLTPWNWLIDGEDDADAWSIVSGHAKVAPRLTRAGHNKMQGLP